MRGIREGDNSDRPNVLLSVLRKTQTVPVIYFGKHQKLFNWNTRWYTCSPFRKGKLRAKVCLREVSQIIIYGWRKFAYIMWFVKVCIPCFNPYEKHLGQIIMLSLYRKGKWFSVSQGSQLQPYSQGRPVNSVLSKQLVISFASKKQPWVRSSTEAIPDQLK